MSKNAIKQTVNDKVKEVNDTLDERTDIINYVSIQDLNVGNSQRSGRSLEPFNGVSTVFGGGNVSFPGKDEKLQQLDEKIQSSLNEASKALSSAQDQSAVTSTDNGNKDIEVEQLNSEITNLKKEFDNAQSAKQEIQAKIDDAVHQKEVKEEQLKAVHQTKEESLQGLNPEQTASFTQSTKDLEGMNVETPVLGEPNPPEAQQ